VSNPAARLVLGFIVLVLLGWGAGELWLQVVGSADRDAVREVAAARTPALTEVVRVVTWLGSSVVLVPLTLVLCVALIRAGMRREALALALSLGGAILLWHVLKPLVSRPRPPVEHLQSVSGSSFPSGHATQASAFWFSAVAALRATRASRALVRGAALLAGAIVLVVAASRVYLGVHYPGDVVAGMLLGTAWAAFVWASLGRPWLR
jgi:undecaprenyl-diphosphatase